MADLKTEFTVEFEGDQIPVTVTEIEVNDELAFMVKIPDHDEFEIFLSEDDMWVSNDEVAIDEDLIFIIGDAFEDLQE